VGNPEKTSFSYRTCIKCIPPAFSTSDQVWVLPRFSAPENKNLRAIVWRSLCDPTFSRFSRTLTCDRQMEGRTDRQTTTANS